MTAAVLAEGRLPGAAFADLPDLEVVDGALAERVRAPRPDVRAAIVLGGRVDAAVLDRLPDLRVVARFGVGYDAVDVDACTQRGVQVAITPGPVEEATAELAVGLILALRRGIPQADAAVRAGGWTPPLGDLPREEGVHAATVGLVGLGRIGRRVARCLAVLGADVCYAARRRVPGETARHVPLRRLLQTSDVVSLHCSLTDETRGLIGAAELALLRDGAALVNTARGPIVDERALIAELLCGRISAALDVLADEPHVPAELRACPNVVLTPHVGSATRAAREQMTRLCVDNVLAVLAGGRARYLVPEQL